jgi:hypothetical protein
MQGARRFYTGFSWKAIFSNLITINCQSIFQWTSPKVLIRQPV